MNSRQHADDICATQCGCGYRMLEFHDGKWINSPTNNFDSGSNETGNLSNINSTYVDWYSNGPK